MHKGRQYRRHLPPNWFPNFDPYWRPAVTWDVVLQWTYAGVHMVTLPAIRLVTTEVRRDLGYLQWAGSYTAGVYSFGIKLRFQVKKTVPDHEIAWAIIDNVGSLMTASILVLGGVNIAADPFVWLVNGSYDVFTSGLWNSLDRTDLHPVHYHEE